MNIKITLVKSLILESVKNETYHSGMVTKAADGGAVSLAFHEQAGDENYHQRILERALATAYSDLTTLLAEYVTNVGDAVGDNTIEATEKNGAIDLVLQVSERFNKGLVPSLAKLCSRYIEESMLVDWWKPVNTDKATYYVNFLQKDVESIRRCFSKTAPDVPTYKYPTAIVLRYPIITEKDGVAGTVTPDMPAVDPVTLYGNPFVMGRGDTSDISYILMGENDAMPIDDIVVRADNTCCVPELNKEGNWCLKGVSIGYTLVTLFSRHNDKVYNKFAVRIV
jgi:hypothetical protein